MESLFNHISNQLSKHFNEPLIITNYKQVFGGDINKTFQLQTNTGFLFLKINDGSLKDMFEKEFEGLELLYQTKTIKTPKPVLYGCLDDTIYLVTEFVQKGNPSKDFWQTFAQQLADLHKHSNEMFGLSHDNYIGSLHQQNNFCSTWSEFYATQRILPLAKLAFNRNKFSKQNLLLTEKLCNRFDELFPIEKPSLIHGDLWSGNFMSDENGAPVIYDPAVYYGNREIDIAMSLLFGGFDKKFYDYYTEVFPLQPGWKERMQLCQLYPLLVHLILFGGHYYDSVINIIGIYN
ncbi:MAG TPA: fructosamine kinase family protein [Parafilimonas sp.]|nr:fructosamine kinase family protein [Parafilimonas sp.]